MTHSRRSSLLSWAASFTSKTSPPDVTTPTSAAPPDASQPPTPTAPLSLSRSSSLLSRINSISSLTTQELDPQVGNHVSRTVSAPVPSHSANNNHSNSNNNSNSSNNNGIIPRSPSKASLTKNAFSSMMESISSLSLNRDKSADDKERGRRRSSSHARATPTPSSSKEARDLPSPARPRSASPSPFAFRRPARHRREPSPHIEALAQSDAESDAESTGPGKRPRNSAFTISPDDSTSDGEGSETEDASDDESSWSDGDPFDDLTESNTERNALTVPPVDDPDGADIDPLGEGVNVVVPPEPLFPTTLHGGHAARRAASGPTRKKTTTVRPEHLPLDTSRPFFQRNRCTIWLTNGDPLQALAADGGGSKRKGRRYVVASDLSLESKYAVEWCIGTVMRDGDEMILVTCSEAENRLDPEDGAVDRSARLRNQQERQTLAYLLVRQATGLLQRTRLNVTIVCQAWHAKNRKHLILDLVDFTEPTMLIVGSRGIGKIKGILLGSTSHYLIQRSSVPVMVARRRLKRPPKRSAHLSAHARAPRVPLAKAAIDKAPSKVETDVAAMRDEMMARDRRGDPDTPEREEGEVDPEAEGVAEGPKA